MIGVKKQLNALITFSLIFFLIFLFVVDFVFCTYLCLFSFFVLYTFK